MYDDENNKTFVAYLDCFTIFFCSFSHLILISSIFSYLFIIIYKKGNYCYL